MKKLLVIVFLLFVNTGFVFCQSNSAIKPDKKLLSHHTQTEIDQLVSDAPSVIEYENFLVSNSYFIEDIDGRKDLSSCSELHFYDSFNKVIVNKTITTSDLMDFNIYDYDFKISATRNYYVIGNTGKLLVVYSKSEIIEKYNKSRGF